MHQPLTGIRVLEIGAYISMPYAASMLSALGADVVKIERPGHGDDFRRGVDDKSHYFRQYNAGKRSLAIDLKHPDGIALVKELLPHFDVLMENMRPGKMEALGLGSADCLAVQPNLVYGSVTGFGNGGPLENRPAYDTIGQSFGGIFSIMSDSGRAALSGTCMADLITALVATTGVLAALAGRARTGEAQVMETSLMEAVSTITIDAVSQYFEDDHTDPSRQSRHPQAQNFVLKTSSGDSISIHLSSSHKFWLAFTDAMSRPELAQDPRFATYAARNENYFDLVKIVEGEFLMRSAEEWEERLGKADVPFAPVLTMGGYLEHPQTQWLGIAEPERDGLSLINPPWRFNGQRPRRDVPTPRVGQHSREVAAEVLSEDQLEALVAEGTLFCS